MAKPVKYRQPGLFDKETLKSIDEERLKRYLIKYDYLHPDHVPPNFSQLLGQFARKHGINEIRPAAFAERNLLPELGKHFALQGRKPGSLKTGFATR